MNQLHPIFAQALAPFMPHIATDDDDTPEHDESEFQPGDEPLCGSCNGSGEGQYDGTTCHACGGTGIDG